MRIFPGNFNKKYIFIRKTKGQDHSYFQMVTVKFPFRPGVIRELPRIFPEGIFTCSDRETEEEQIIF